MCKPPPPRLLSLRWETPSLTATAPPPTATIAGPMRWPRACRPPPPRATSVSPIKALVATTSSTTASAQAHLARFNRDVLAPAGVRWVIVFEGVNDLGGLAREGEVSPAEHAAMVQRVIAAYQQIILRAHAHGLRVYGATITPYVGSNYYHPGPLSEADRQAVNAWIRTAGHFDAVIDFDAVLRDPQHPDQLLPANDCGDHLHPSPAGYKAMADAIPLTLFAP